MEVAKNGALQADPTPRRQPAVVLTVTARGGELDPEAINAELLRLIRQHDQGCGLCETELARRCKMTRQNLHNLHHENPLLTLVTLCKWCNGHRVALEFVIAYGAQRVRRRQARRLGQGSS